MSEESAGGRLEGGGCQGATEIRFVKADDTEAGALSVLAQPSERQFVAGGQDDQGVRSGVPGGERPRIRHSKLEGGVARLTGLRARGQIVPRDDQQAGLSVRALAVWHESRVAHGCRRSSAARPEKFRITRGLAGSLQL